MVKNQFFVSSISPPSKSPRPLVSLRFTEADGSIICRHLVNYVKNFADL